MGRRTSNSTATRNSKPCIDRRRSHRRVCNKALDVIASRNSGYWAKPCSLEVLASKHAKPSLEAKINPLKLWKKQSEGEAAKESEPYHWLLKQTTSKINNTFFTETNHNLTWIYIVNFACGLFQYPMIRLAFLCSFSFCLFVS